MRIAVTGATGFVGRHVVAELARREVDIVASARRPGQAVAANVQWVALDLANPPDDCFAALLRPDVLLHLAWGGLPNYRASRHVEIELPLQYAFLENAIRHGLPALVAAGTCLEYGMQSGQLAATGPTAPTTAYGIAKDNLHNNLVRLQSSCPCNITWARLFYMYGEDQSASSLYPALRAAALSGQREFPMSGGEQLRDYLPVEAVARRLADLATHPAERGAVNVCSGKPVSVRQLVEGWIAQNGWDVGPKYGVLPYPDYEPMTFWGDPGQDSL